MRRVARGNLGLLGLWRGGAGYAGRSPGAGGHAHAGVRRPRPSSRQSFPRRVGTAASSTAAAAPSIRRFPRRPLRRHQADAATIAASPSQRSIELTLRDRNLKRYCELERHARRRYPRNGRDGHKLLRRNWPTGPHVHDSSIATRPMAWRNRHQWNGDNQTPATTQPSQPRTSGTPARRPKPLLRLKSPGFTGLGRERACAYDHDSIRDPSICTLREGGSRRAAAGAPITFRSAASWA